MKLADIVIPIIIAMEQENRNPIIYPYIGAIRPIPMRPLVGRRRNGGLHLGSDGIYARNLYAEVHIYAEAASAPYI